jgi:hypothetical protein
MFLQSLWLHSSPMTNDGLTVKYEPAITKQLWVLQQWPNSKYRTLNMIIIDKLHHLTHCWFPYICFFSHFDSIHHHDKWWPQSQLLHEDHPQILYEDHPTAKDCGYCSNGLFLDTGYKVWLL